MKKLLRFQLSTVLLALPLFAMMAAILSHWATRHTSVTWNRTTLPYVDPVIPPAFLGDYSYPSARKEVSVETVDGPTTYREFHLRGFEWCLINVATGAVYKDDSVFNSWDALGDWQVPPSEAIPLADGYDDCRERLMALRTKMPDDELRRALAIKRISPDKSKGKVFGLLFLIYGIALFSLYLWQRRLRRA